MAGVAGIGIESAAHACSFMTGRITTRHVQKGVQNYYWPGPALRFETMPKFPETPMQRLRRRSTPMITRCSLWLRLLRIYTGVGTRGKLDSVVQGSGTRQPDKYFDDRRGGKTGKGG
ncbi:hypothetical protein VTH06DRAFT_2058 [Thermothelomyces fergusii]